MKHVAIARSVRQWAEDLAKTTEEYPDSLGGLCAIASAELFNRLKGAGFDNTLIAYTDKHVYVVLDGYVIDVTATQFGNYPKVFIETVSYARDCGIWWNATDFYESVDNLRAKQIEECWHLQHIVKPQVHSSLEVS